MAIKEFIIGPQNYFEEGYFDGDYTLPNVSKFYLQCDIDNIKGGRVVTGEYFLDNYIDGTYWHNNSIKFELLADAMIVQEATVSLQDYYVEGYYEPGYYKTQGSNFTLTAELTRTGEDVFATGAWTTSATMDITAVKIVDAVSSMAVEFTVTAYGARDRDIDLFAFSEAAIAVQVEVIRDLNISATAVFSIATDGRRFRDIAAAETSLFSFDVVNSRSRAFTIETQAAFSLASSYTNYRPFAADITSTTIVSATISHIEGADLIVNGFATLDITPQYVKLASAGLTSSASVSAVIETRIGIIANLVTTASVYARPKAGVTWVDAYGQSLPQNPLNSGRLGATVSTSTYKFGSGSLYVPGNATTGNERGILATLNANDLSIPTQNTNFSFSFWFKADQSPLGGYAYPFFQGGLTSNDTTSTARTYYRASIDRTYLTFRYKIGANTGRNYSASMSGITLTNWNFFEIAGVWNGTNRDLKFYVNGVLKITTDGLVGGNYSYLTGAVPVTSDDLARPSIYGFNDSYGYFLDDFQYRTGSGSVIGTNAPTAQVIPDSYTKTLLTFNGDFSDVVGAMTIPGYADLYANASLTANVDSIKLVETSAAIASTFTQTATGNVSRDLASSVTSAVTQTATAIKITDASSTVDVATAQTAIGNVTRTLAADVTAAFTQTSTAVVSKSFASAIAANFAQSASAVKTVDADIITEAIATELASVAKIGDFLVTIESVATLSIDLVITASGASVIAVEATADIAGNYISNNIAMLADSFSVTAEVHRNRYASATLVTQSTVVAMPILVSVNSIDVDSYFTLNGSAMKFVGVSSTQSMSAVVNAEIQITKDFYCDLATEAAVNVTVNATLAADIALISNSSLNAIISHIEGADIVVDSFATMTTAAEAGMFGQAALDSTTTLVANNVKVRFAESAINAESSVTAQINEIVPLQAALSSVTTQEVTASITASANSALTTTSTVTATISHIEGADIVVDGFATLAATAMNVKGVNSTIASSAALTATVNEIVNLTAAVNVNVTLSVNATIAQNGAAAITTAATVTAAASSIKQLAASIDSAMTFTANVMEIDIDSINQTVYMIPAENREWNISKEIWSRNIAEETREYII